LDVHFAVCNHAATPLVRSQLCTLLSCSARGDQRSAYFGPAMAVLVVTPLGSSQTLSGDLLDGLFDLSPAEIRAAQGLLAGKSIDDIATDLGLSRETIRSQVKAVLAKTGTSRQAGLIALLSNVKTPTWHAKT
jgi:DNA-binding CsgD family transcriptional regulator